MTEEYLEELIQKYADGTASDEEIRRLMHWYRDAPIGDVHWNSTDPEEKEKVPGRMLNRLTEKISPQQARRVTLPWLRAAAILLIFLGTAALLVSILKPFSKSYITVKNPPGRIQWVRLPDSSMVLLNASSTLRYPKAFEKTRELRLEGEAYFQVKHDSKHPFIVESDGIQTTVLGTSFNIKAYAPENITRVSLVTGSVKVSNNGKDLAVLTPSTQLEFDEQGQTSRITTVDTGAVLAWKNGLLKFEGQSFGEIANTIERRYGVNILFANPGMRSCRYYMSFDNSTSLEKLLSTMAETGEIKYSINKNTNTVTLSGNACR